MSGRATISFEGFSGYLNSMSYYAGYGGMSWNAMYEVQSAFITEHSWCDTGYNNVLHGLGEGITQGSGGFQSYNLSQTFNLERGVFASAWETNQPVYFNSYTYTQGQGFSLKASVKIVLGQNATVINFGNYGTDFKHISEVMFVSGQGQGGNTCSYGAPTYGYLLAMDNLKIRWNGVAAADDRGLHRSDVLHHPFVHHHHLPHLAASSAPEGSHNAHATAAGGAAHATGPGDGAYHSQLLSLSHEDTAGLTNQFALPHTEHFGT